MHRMVRVGRDRKFTTLGLGGPNKRSINIQPLRAGVDLQPNTSPGGLSRHSVEIELVPIAMQQQATSKMAQNTQRGTFERFQQTVGHLGWLQIHVTVHTADDNIEFSKRIVL